MILRGALRLPVRVLRGAMRSARLALCALLPVLAGTAQASDAWIGAPLISAEYADPTTRYAHGVLGDAVEHGTLVLQYAPPAARYVIKLPIERVFEDTAPRLADVDGDGQQEAIVVESHADQGARLAIYNAAGLFAATPYIGRTHRWLAPIGAADLDGDGQIEIAYIDRPHLAKTLRIWRLRNGRLVELAAVPGLTNHRIGERDIAGGIRDCGTGPEMIVASSDWRSLQAVSFDGASTRKRTIGQSPERSDFADALACRTGV